jgi:type I restriction enzyme S subunit
MSTIPELRFKEFSEEWEEKNYGDIYSFYTTNSLSRDKLNYEDGQVYNIHYGDIHKRFSTMFKLENELIPYVNNDIDLSKINDENYCQIGDLVIADASEDYNDIGKTIEIISLNDKKTIAGLHTFLARPNKYNMALGYMGYMLKSWNIRKQVMMIAQGTKVLSLSIGRLSKVKLNIPKKQEQEKIASFLTSVDTKIELLNEKIELLEEYKKGVIQKIFSQEIRFKDDDGENFDDWKIEKLDNILDYIVDNRGKTPPISDNGIPLIEVNAIGNKHIIYTKVTKFVNDTTFNEWFRKYLKNGDILFSTVGQTALCSLYSDDTQAVIAQNIVGLRFNKECDSSFMYYLLTEKYNNHQFKKIEMGAVQPSVKISQMIYLKFSIPELAEQIRIANFLSSIDKKIDLVQEQLNQTKEFKKALLQQMFI